MAEAARGHPFGELTAPRVLDALERVGIRGDGRIAALGSYENRVYQVWQEDGPSVVAKFYRPQRWSRAQVEEEHAFVAELVEHELPVVAPMRLDERTLHEDADILFAVYPRQGGRAPELDRNDVLEWIGRLMGRMHAIGASRRFGHRPSIDVESFGARSRAFLLEGPWLPPELAEPYATISALALEGASAAFERAGGVTSIRLHGDCHAGNMLWTEGGPHFVDFDDTRMGPAIQDLWMLLSGDRASMEEQLGHVLAGYERFFEFDRRELHLVEALRTLRLMHYAAWIAQRWDDPAFPAAFPWFGTQRYWQDRVLELREQVAAMAEEVLVPARLP